MKRRFLIVFTMIFALVFGLGVLSACGGGNGSGDLTISETEVTLAIGETTRLTATDKSGGEVSWSSSDENVVTIRSQVAAKGIAVIEAVGAGKATVTAESASGKKVSCEVTVENIVVEISGEGVADGKLTMERYATLKLTGAVKKDGQTLSGETLTWASSDSEIVSVTDDGTVTAVSEGTATISATRKGGAKAEISVTVVWSERPDNWYALHDWEQNKITPNLWGYWVDAGYEPQYSTNIKVINAEYLGDPTGTGLVAGGVTMTYENTLDGANEHGVQLFYRSSKGYTQYDAQYDASKLLLEVGKNYVLKMDITVSASGTITVNGTQYEVVANQKLSIEAPFLHDDDGRIHDTGDYSNVNSAVYVMMGANGTMIQAATVRLENVRWEAWDGGTASLETPTFTVSGKNVTITDPNKAGVKSYTIGLFEKDAAVDADPVRSFTFTEKTATIDDAKWPNGDYELRIRANGTDKRYGDSAWSQGQAYKVDHGPVTYNLKEGNAATAKADLTDTYYYSLQDGATVETATYNDGNITFKYAGNVNWYSVQIFYKNPALTAGAQYTLTFTLNSPLAGKIRINAKMFDLVEGDNSIEVTYVEGTGADGLSMNIQFGEPTEDYQGTTAVLAEGTFELKNITWTKYVTPPGTLLEGGEKAAVDNPGTFYLWWDQNWNGATVTMTERSFNEAEKTIHFAYTSTGDDIYGAGVQLFYKLPGAVTGNEYKITLTIKVSVDCTIRVCGQVEEFKAGVERTLTITKAEAASSTLSIIMGTFESEGNFTNVKAADVTISNWKIEDDTQEPTKPADPSDYTYGADILPSANAMVNSGKSDYDQATRVLDTFMYWYVQDVSWNNGSVVNLKTHTYENNTITFTYQGGDVAHSVQLFYGNSHMTAGKEYKISFTVTATKDMTITVNGKQIALKAGQQTQVEYIFTLATNALEDKSPWAADIQLPGMSDEVTVTISGLKWNEATKK